MPKRKHLKPVPRFKSEAEERAFWEVHDTADHLDWSRAKVGIFPNLKPSTETISLRLPSHLLAELKTLANKRDVPYQSLLKVFLAERVAQELAGNAAAMPAKRFRLAPVRRGG
jgi:predicted DNA binding CopG/RHH family protein